jgi:hypothetical protein
LIKTLRQKYNFQLYDATKKCNNATKCGKILMPSEYASRGDRFRAFLMDAFDGSLKAAAEYFQINQSNFSDYILNKKNLGPKWRNRLATIGCNLTWIDYGIYSMWDSEEHRNRFVDRMNKIDPAVTLVKDIGKPYNKPDSEIDHETDGPNSEIAKLRNELEQMRSCMDYMMGVLTEHLNKSDITGVPLSVLSVLYEIVHDSYKNKSSE